MKTQKRLNARRRGIEMLTFVLVIVCLQTYSAQATCVVVNDTNLYKRIQSAELIDVHAYALAEAATKHEKIAGYTALYSIEVMEEEMLVEQWMLNANDEFWDDCKVDCEEELELEPWMLDASLW